MTIRKRFLDGGNGYNGEYIPLYLNEKGEEIEMQRNSALKERIIGMRHLSLNPNGKESAYLIVEKDDLPRSSIKNLRAAVFQINEKDADLLGLKEELIRILNSKEEDLLSKFLSENMFYQRITEVAVEDFC